MPRMPETARAALAGLILVAGLAAGPALAQHGGLSERPGITFTLGGGVQVRPTYPGASSFTVGPGGSFGVDRLVLPGGFGFGSPDARPLEPGFGPRGAFRYVRPRKPGDAPELAGLPRVGHAVELGAGLAHVTEFGRTFAEVRRGFGGHEGVVGEVGIDAILRPDDRFVLTAGPRAMWGNARYVNTYFGVPTPTASFPATYRAGSGLVSVGAAITGDYDLGGDWGLRGTLAWDRLHGDAGRSPITAQGSRDQFRAQLLLTRRFSLGH